MGPFGRVLVLIFGISFMTFVTFFGRLPALRHTPIAGLYRLIWVHTPNVLLKIDQRVTAGRLSTSCASFGNYMMYDRHPTVVIFFVTTLAVAEMMFLPTAWPLMSLPVKITGCLAIVCPYVFLYLACAADPGYVTEESLPHLMTLYPYDFILFHPGRVCRTCNLPKPPRSKHCTVCKKCVARSDHHCIFINSCVGLGNHHYFLLLLLSTAILTSYGGVLGMSLLSAHVHENHPTWQLWKPNTTMSWTRWLGLFSIGIRQHLGLGASTLLAAMISPLIWGLFLYSLYLVYAGVTTNESLKWSEWKEDTRDGYAFARPLPTNRQIAGEPTWTRWPKLPATIMVTTDDAEPPLPEQQCPGVGEWERPRSLRDVENVYDIGFWGNLKDVFLVGHYHGSENGEPLSERKRYDKRAANGGRYPP
ncbi:DHHC palmitoyltransferase-domain-containing protein [Emericellopsis atlantica]|uniref:Palmitoyltransferase n=1 Tax=Emericellopsis atlantica TaxID=2614577 RepID=A0A9P7ZRJ2_9HYPO|nr:DHHC palmitoyltransferase-domain-containing protein [Emericellopsis atlantica]KAG9256900.1 DHHC palmitoyltransferase-domain-containing protein [Emericellopsis atlantica]